MKKVVKLKQSDVEKIVKNIINENEEIDELVMPGVDLKQRIVYAAKDDEGNYYIVDAKTGDILAKDNPNKDMADDSLPMAAE
jgi:hypothetical protein